MKKFMLLHYGFEKPTPDIMAEWQRWFGAIAERSVENGGFHSGGREITHDGTNELPFGADSITGYSIITAEDLDEATAIAADNPFIHSIRIYEINQQ